MNGDLIPSAYYWIMRNEPDGPPFWEPAQFMGCRSECWDYWNGKHLPADAPMMYRYWTLLGKQHQVRQVETAGASNAWVIGPRILTPLEIIERIELIGDNQPDLSELWGEFWKLEKELLGDPSGVTLKAIRADRTADYWESSRRPESQEQTAYFRKRADDLWARSPMQHLRRVRVHA